MASWSNFASTSQDMAEKARRLLTRSGEGEAMLTTVIGEEPPRTHPVNVGWVDDRLLVFVQAKSSKAEALAADGRYALASHQDPSAPHELLVRGRAHPVANQDLLDRAAQSWAFTADDTYSLYELDVETVLLGERDSPEEWPPRYSAWNSGPVARG